MKNIIVIILFFSLLEGCEKIDTPEGTPHCIDRMIKDILKESVWNPPARVYRYNYNGQIVYYIPPRCCDMYSILVDENCNVICHPDGGFTGGGDGRCNDFFSTRTDGKLIWKDER